MNNSHYMRITGAGSSDDRPDTAELLLSKEVLSNLEELCTKTKIILGSHKEIIFIKWHCESIYIGRVFLAPDYLYQKPYSFYISTDAVRLHLTATCNSLYITENAKWDPIIQFILYINANVYYTEWINFTKWVKEAGTWLRIFHGGI